MKKRVAAYCRVSTKSDDQENSFENQKSFFEREYKNNADYMLYDIYADKGMTGTTLNKRPDFNRMLTDAGLDINDGYKIIAKPKFDLIVTKNTSRFARNVSVDVILKALAQNNVYVHFLDLDKSTENPDDITYIQIFLTFDERESRDKSKKVLFGLEEGIKKGNIHTNGHLFGYKYYPKPENRLEIIEDEAEVVRLIFDLYVYKGLGFYRIGNYLKQKNIKTRNGKDFSEQGLRLIITNEVYTGRGVRKKYTEGYVFNKHNRRETGNAVIFDTEKIPAIIDMQTFEKAQEILHGRIQHTSLKGKYAGKTAYAGKIICGCCGEKYIASNGDYLAQYGRRVRNYACKSKRVANYDKDGNRVMLCNNPNIYETKLDSEITKEKFSEKYKIMLKASAIFLLGVRETLAGRINKQDIAQIEAVQKELDVIIDKKGKLLDLYVDGNFGKEELDVKVSPLTEKERVLRERIKMLSKTNDEIQMDIDDIEQTIAEIKERMTAYEQSKDNKDMSKAELLADVDKITITASKSVLVSYKFELELRRYFAKYAYILPAGAREEFTKHYLG